MAAMAAIAVTAKVISKPLRFTPRRAALSLVSCILDHNKVIKMFL